MKKKILTMALLFATGISVKVQKKTGIHLLATHNIGSGGGKC
ncbi:hypothetical protein [Pedobacter frigidisoli]|nr:hypothetical protein [Pedobacter frigidisoli]